MPCAVAVEAAPASTLPAGTQLVVGVRHVFDDNDLPTGTATLMRRDGESQLLAPGDWVCFEVVGSRYCLGPVGDNGLRTACPNGATVEKAHGSHALCSDCATRHHVSQAMRGGHVYRSLSPSPVQHVVYLAAYDEETIKVGIARAGREDKRLSEQGARAALIIAEASTEGEAARIEREVKSIPIADILSDRPKRTPDRLSAKQKLEMLRADCEGESLLPQLRDRATELFYRSRLLQRTCLSSPPKHSKGRPTLAPRELTFNQRRLALPQSLTKVAPGLVLEGRFQGVIGSLFVLDTEKGPLAVPSKSLAGWALRSEDVAAPREQLALAI